MNILEIFSAVLAIAENKKYSDIHINSGCYPIIRDNSGDIVEISFFNTPSWEMKLEKLTNQQVLEIIIFILWKENYEIYKNDLEIDGSHEHTSGERYRINCYKDSNWDSIALRSIPHEIPSLESLGLWERIKQMCQKSKWLILVTGPTGTWKSTNLAWMINYINTNFKNI